MRLNWPGRSEETQFSFADLAAHPELCEKDKNGLQVVSFYVYFAKRLGARFAQQANFITDLEAFIPDFYREVGQDLIAWRKPAPRIKSDQMEANLEAIQEEAEGEAL